MGHGRRRKRRTHRPIPDSEYEGVPRSFVMRTGQLGSSAHTLVRDFRRVMQPYTAIRLKEQNHNKMRDVLKSAIAMGVSHLVLFKQTEVGTNVRFARVPQGPTVQLRVASYSLMADIVASQARPRAPGQEYQTPPLVVLNNFSEDDRKLKLTASMFQNMFPAINLKEVKLSDTRRVVLFNYDKETDRIDFRHYMIRVLPIGMSKRCRTGRGTISAASSGSLRPRSPTSATTTTLPTTSCAIHSEAQASESEVEDADNSVTLPQNYVGRGNTKNQQRGIRLIELGPRMQLELLKIQKGFCGGDVLYHEHIHKTPEEIRALEAARKKKDAEKAARRREQERNVQRKQAAKEAQRRADRVRVGLPPEREPAKDSNGAVAAAGSKRARSDADEEGSDAEERSGDEDEGEEEGGSDDDEGYSDVDEAELDGEEDEVEEEEEGDDE